MPYKAVGKCVYKKTATGGRGAKVGCTKKSVQAYMRALYANEPGKAKMPRT